MRVKLTVYPEPTEAEVDVSLEDLLASVLDEPDTPRSIAVFLSNVYSVLLRVPDELIAKMDPGHRQTIVDAYQAQIERLRLPLAEAAKLAGDQVRQP
jgi:hypothetical protein